MLGGSELKVRKVTALVQIGLVIIMPLRLPPSVTLNLVRKRSTLSKRMVFLRRSVARIIFGKSSQICKSCIKSLRSFFFKDSLCLTRNDKMSLVPEGCGLLD